MSVTLSALSSQFEGFQLSDLSLYYRVGTRKKFSRR